MSDPELQHYLPRFYLEGFRDEAVFRNFNKSVLYAFEPRKPIRTSTPRAEARQRNIYTLKNVEDKFAVEKMFARLETTVSQIIPKLSEKHYTLSSDGKEYLS